eukprot:2833862-Pleurochrysis_carterae.AAC.1
MPDRRRGMRLRRRQASPRPGGEMALRDTLSSLRLEQRCFIFVARVFHSIVLKHHGLRRAAAKFLRLLTSAPITSSCDVWYYLYAVPSTVVYFSPGFIQQRRSQAAVIKYIQD